eukprot:gene27225-biopygen17759
MALLRIGLESDAAG